MRHAWRSMHQRIGQWRCSKTSAMRWLRATSWARTVGERSLAGRLISRVHTEMPSHMLRADELEPEVSPIGFTQRVVEARLAIEAVEIGADELAVLHANAGIIDEIGNAARGVDLIVGAVRSARFRLDDLDAVLQPFSMTRMRASRAYGEVYVTYSFIEASHARVMVKVAR